MFELILDYEFGLKRVWVSHIDIDLHFLLITSVKLAESIVC